MPRVNHTSLDIIKSDFNSIVETIDNQFGVNYASKNPSLVTHLLEMVQREEERAFSRELNSN